MRIALRTTSTTTKAAATTRWVGSYGLGEGLGVLDHVNNFYEKIQAFAKLRLYGEVKPEGF